MLVCFRRHHWLGVVGTKRRRRGCAAITTIRVSQECPYRACFIAKRKNSEHHQFPILGYSSSSSSFPLIVGQTLGPDIQQRSDEWFNLRKDRLTASAYSSASGFWRGGRAQTWEEKAFLLTKPVAPANPAMEWGTDREAFAISRYKEISGNSVESLAFKVYKDGDDESCGWLGASPDGLIDRGRSGVYENGGGVLEVKCPHNKGKPQLCLPWSDVPYYYVPQAQGLMEVLDRDWLDFYVWTVNGSAIFRCQRDHQYWSLLYSILREFWWENVVPARNALAALGEGDEEGSHSVARFRPSEEHRLTPLLIKQSRILAGQAVLLYKDIGGNAHPLT